MTQIKREESRLRLSINAARKAMAEGKSPSEAVSVIEQMLADQHTIDTLRVKTSTVRTDGINQIAVPKRQASPET